MIYLTIMISTILCFMILILGIMASLCWAFPDHVMNYKFAFVLTFWFGFPIGCFFCLLKSKVWEVRDKFTRIKKLKGWLNEDEKRTDLSSEKRNL